MHGHHHTHVVDPGPLKVSPALKFGLLGLGILGLVIFLASAFTGTEEARKSAWNGFTVSYMYFFFLSMGAAAFLAIQYLVSAKWFVAIKRLPEAMASFMTQGGFILPLIALFGLGYVYSWALPDRYYPYEGTMKAWWISHDVHVVKVIVIIALLTGMTYLLLRCSQMKIDSPAKHMTRLRVSIIFLIIFGFAFSLFAWDALMSTEPKWFSTMFGVYTFIGGFQTALALMMLSAFWLQSKAQSYIETKRQLYDIGTYVMGFSTFWMYIAFSQFMLIWYANIPDEIFWYLKRIEEPWLVLLIALPVLKWVVPFFILMPSSWRTKKLTQGIACICIFTGQAVDLWLITTPVSGELSIIPSFVNIMTFLGVFGIFGFTTLNYLSSRSLLPVEDPDLLSSVNGEYLHA